MPQKFQTLVDLFDHATKQYASRPLFGTKVQGTWQWLTYGDFGKEVDKIRAGFARLGLKSGDAVALIANNRAEWAITAYAAFGLGVFLVPMYEAQLDKDWEYIVRDCAATALVVATPAIAEKTARFLKDVPSLKHIVCLDDAFSPTSDAMTTWKALASGSADVPANHPSPSDTACIIYTSGTTGNPKGVVLSHSNLAANVSAVNEMFPIGQDDRSLSFLPWAHSFGQTCELHTLMSVGASMGLAESVEKIIPNLAEVQPTLLFSVPRIFNKIYAGVQKTVSEKPKAIQALVRGAMRAAGKIRNGEEPSLGETLMLKLANKLVFSKVRARFGGRLQYAFSGGAAISREVAEFIDGLGITVYEGYGLTETSPIATANRPGARRIGSIGKAIPGVDIVIDSDGKKTDKGYAEGEIVVFGHNVMQGYHRRPDDDAAVFCGRDFAPWGDRPKSADRGFRTGDMGYIDNEGFVFISGRIKEQYKLENGKYVVPTPLEETLKLSPFVLNAMVYGDNKPFNVALLVANVPAIREWASRDGISLPASEDAIVADPKVRELFKKEVAEQASHWKGFESVGDFALVSEDFTAENGMLTPSLKVKRRAVMERYGAQIEALYKKDKSAR